MSGVPSCSWVAGHGMGSSGEVAVPGGALGLEARVAALERRSREKDADKYWETSWARFLLVCALTYASLALYMWAAGIDPVWVNAVVPAAAYAISATSFEPLRRVWSGFTQ